MSEKLKVWVVRDGEKDGQNHHGLYAFLKKPTYQDWLSAFRVYPPEVGNCVSLLQGLFPQIKNGECFEAEIVLGEKL